MTWPTEPCQDYADRDRLWNAERNVSPLASGVALADGYDAGLLLEKFGSSRCLTSTTPRVLTGNNATPRVTLKSFSREARSQSRHVRHA